MKRYFLLFAAALSLSVACSRPEDDLKDIADKVFAVAKEQCIAMDAALTDDTCPRTLDGEGRLRTSDMGWWCSGFYPGTLWYVYEYTGDETFRDLAWKHTRKLEGLKDRHTDHDIGFQINCSYGNALRLTGDSSAVVPVYVASAYRLAGRFTPAAGVIRSWDFLRNDWRYPVIIDNMMNLELLTVASRMSGDTSLADVANAHAHTTLKNHFREDWTSWHLVDYDPETGDVRYRETVQGYAHDSAWARGQAWSLYGYTMMFRETGLPEYLEAAEKIAAMIMDRLPEDGIPYWDFNAPGTPDALGTDAPGAAQNPESNAAEPLRDASAGAVMASAFVELSTLSTDVDASEAYLETARRQLRTLAGDGYLAKPGENGGFILRHSVGSLPGNSEVDVPLTYADYYFLEALVRYSRL